MYYMYGMRMWPSWTLRFVAGCVVAAVLTLSVGVVLLLLLMRGPAVELLIRAPADVESGGPFRLVITVTNPSKTVPVLLTGLEFDGSYVTQRVSIESSDPAWRIIDYYSGHRLYEYLPIFIGPLASEQVTFTMHAESTGVFTGHVTAQTRRGLEYPSGAGAVSTIRIQAFDRIGHVGDR